MKDNLTEVVFVLDRSGSMGNLVDDTIGGFNSFIEEQKKLDGEAVLTTVLFDDKYEVLHDSVNLKDIKPITNKDYFARGMTALLDAIGKTINSVGSKLNAMQEEDRPSKVVFVITTDGQENASNEFTKEKIKEMIEHQTQKYNWQFLFLGANIDAISEAKILGIDMQYAATYSANPIGTRSVYSSVSKGVEGARSSTGVVDTSWKDEIK